MLKIYSKPIANIKKIKRYMDEGWRMEEGRNGKNVALLFPEKCSGRTYVNFLPAAAAFAFTVPHSHPNSHPHSHPQLAALFHPSRIHAHFVTSLAGTF